MLAQTTADAPMLDGNPKQPASTPPQPNATPQAPASPQIQGLPPMTPPTQPVAPGLNGTQPATPPTATSPNGSSGLNYLNSTPNPPGSAPWSIPAGVPGNLPITNPGLLGQGPQGLTYVNQNAGQAPTSITLSQEAQHPLPTPGAVGSTPSGSPLPPPVTPSLQPAGVPIANGVNASATDPNNNLTGQTILPGAQADRFALAKSNLSNFANATDPYYQKSLLDAQKGAAGSGQLGSGQLRTSLGDLAYNRDLQLGAQGTSFLNDALNNSVDDAYKNAGIAQQQQGFQAGQQQTAFNQAATQAELQNELLNGATNRASTQLTQGNAGNPADTSLLLSQLFGNQAAAGQQAVGSLIGNTVNRNAQTSQTSALQSLLASLGLGTAQGAPQAPAAPTVPTTDNGGGTGSAILDALNKSANNGGLFGRNP